MLCAPADYVSVKHKVLFSTVAVYLVVVLSLGVFPNTTNSFFGVVWSSGMDLTGSNFLPKSNFSSVYPVNLSFDFCLDSVSLAYIALSAYIIPICLLSNWLSLQGQKNFQVMFLILLILLLLVFSTGNLFVFYIAFEVILIPMYILIGSYGSRSKRVLAANHFFLYTFMGSIFMLFSLIYIWSVVGNLNITSLMKYSGFSFNESCVIWLSFFFAFAVKVPMFPFHIWLTEAHVEAPTSGSILLAGVLLKLGTYAMFRFLIFLFPTPTIFFASFVKVLAIISSLYCAINALRQKDIKRVVALSSVVHMNVSLLGFFMFKLEGVVGNLFSGVTHGIVSGALFYLVGVIYDRFRTRNVLHVSGVVNLMPVFSVFFFLFTLGNISFPGTCSFIGELLVLSSFVGFSLNVGLLASVGLGVSMLYSVWCFNQVTFGAIHFTQSASVFSDMNRREVFGLALPLFLLFMFGIFPNNLINLFLVPSYNNLYLLVR
jgi:proton-translocating NADH-quinone oxidoreductase chain M